MRSPQSYCCFFFSSRRRHTSCYRDWSSDVCSSDLFSTAVTWASGVRPNFWTIVSGFPAGCASFDHSLKNELRTSLICVFGAYWTHLYGPVPGGGMLTFFVGVLDGRMNANGTASLSRNSGSEVVRWNVIVSPSTTMPFERSHVFGVLMHASAPWMTLYQVPAFGLLPILKSRSKVARTSAPSRVEPSENLIPDRSLKVQVLPPFVGLGIASARSGTFTVPGAPATRLKAIRPSCEVIRSCHSWRV